MITAMAVTLGLTVRCYAQTAAPTALPSCLIAYTDTAFDNTTSRLILYNPDQTFVEISARTQNYITFAGQASTLTLPPSVGSFTYAVDPHDATHATLSYTGADSTLNNDQLYFLASNSGWQTPLGATSAGSSTGFVVYPRQATNGACNVSNRCQLAAGATATTGFVVQSGGPRWVLIRAVGESLGNFGVASTVASPAFVLYDSSQTIVGTSAVWSADPNLVSGYCTVFSLVGAFPLSGGSDEGVLLVALKPGAYTVQFSAGSAGTLLGEVYVLGF